MRRFNTEGPVRLDKHYAIPPLDRANVEELLGLIQAERYFVLHAPRQTGKTSALLALRDLLNEAGEVLCVYANFEVGQALRENLELAMRAMLDELASRALAAGDGFLEDAWLDVLAKSGPGGVLRGALTRWAMASPKPLVLLIDEIDSLVGDTLLSVLRQLRAGYDRRPEGFPQSIVLCGVRDIQDYRIRSSSGEMIAGGSPFNVAAKSLRLGDFTEAETGALIAQHTAETGQQFEPEALAAVWEQTQGQPWLVNALCAGACFDRKAGRDRSQAITADHIFAAREELILSRRTHLDQLAHKLEEERVRRVIEPLLSDADPTDCDRSDIGFQRDIDYVRDLGLIAAGNGIRMANPIYAEVVPRELTAAAQERLLTEQTAWYVKADGDLDMDKLLAAFQAFFREHSEHWLGRFDYREAGPQLILQAYLQRIVNGGGRIEREYGLGRGATDLLILWPHKEGLPSDLWRRFVVECKVLRDGDHRGLAGTIERGLEQTLDYMDKCGGGEGHLVVFDRTGEAQGTEPGESSKRWEDRLFRREETRNGRTVAVWGM